MAVQTVFSDNLDPSNFNLSDRFIDAVAFYIDAPLIDSDLEIDVFLQVYFPTATSQRIRNFPLAKISEQSILLNQTDTESVVAIPDEFLGTGLEMALLFLASSITFLEAYIVTKNYNTIQRLQDDIDQIKEQLSRIEAGVEDNGGNIATFIEQIFFLLQ